MPHLRAVGITVPRLVVLVVVLVAAACGGETTVDTPAAAVPESTAIEEATTAPPADASDSEAASDATEGDDDLAELGATLFGSSEFGADLSPTELSCAIAKLADDLDLLERSRTFEDITELALDDQADLALIAFDCAPELVADQFAEGLASSGQVSLPPEVGECMIERMSEGAPNRRDVILGFAALGGDLAIPVDSQPAVVDTMVECLPGDVFAQAIADVALADPMFASALDLGCITDSLDGETMRPMWQAMVENPGFDFEQLPPEATRPLLDAIFGCVSFGEVIAAQAAGTGVTLSASTITCIDTALADLDLAQLVQTGAGADEMTSAMLGCLTPEEFAAIAGSG